MSLFRIGFLMPVFMLSFAGMSQAATSRAPLLERYMSTPTPQDPNDAKAAEAFSSAKCQIFEDSIVVEFKTGGLWTSRSIPQRFDVRQIRALLTEARKKQVPVPELSPEALVVLYVGHLDEEDINLLYNRSSQAEVLSRFLDMNCGSVPQLK